MFATNEITVNFIVKNAIVRCRNGFKVNAGMAEVLDNVVFYDTIISTRHHLNAVINAFILSVGKVEF